MSRLSIDDPRAVRPHRQPTTKAYVEEAERKISKVMDTLSELQTQLDQVDTTAVLDRDLEGLLENVLVRLDYTYNPERKKRVHFKGQDPHPALQATLHTALEKAQAAVKLSRPQYLPQSAVNAIMDTVFDITFKGKPVTPERYQLIMKGKRNALECCSYEQVTTLVTAYEQSIEEDNA